MWLIERLKEPSTHAGVAALILVIAGFFPQYKDVIMTIAGLFGFVAVAVPEQKQ